MFYLLVLRYIQHSGTHFFQQNVIIPALLFYSIGQVLWKSCEFYRNVHIALLKVQQ